MNQKRGYEKGKGKRAEEQGRLGFQKYPQNGGGRWKGGYKVGGLLKSILPCSPELLYPVWAFKGLRSKTIKSFLSKVR
jgi:hypothetical protein